MICRLCPHECSLKEGVLGFCRQRTVKDGRIISLNYGRISALALDPMEKKPLYHFYPGSKIFSVGSLGCNLHCLYCQNSHIAQREAATIMMQPGQLVELALETKQEEGNLGLAFTYNEPTMAYEFVKDSFELAQDRGLKTILITNGYLQKGPWRKLIQKVHALNIDVKAFRNQTNARLCSGSLAPVLENISAALTQAHVELTYLVVPGLNDSRQEMEELSRWIKALSPDIPLHLSRYFPSYKLRQPATPLTTLYKLQATAKGHLNYVYLGNVGEAAPSCCPHCGEILVRRKSRVIIEGLEGGRCRACGSPVAFVATPTDY